MFFKYSERFSKGKDLEIGVIDINQPGFAISKESSSLIFFTSRQKEPTEGGDVFVTKFLT